MLLGLAALAFVELRAALELAPAALLAATLYLGYRPGEKLIERIAVLIRRLLAIDLAMRPPPVSVTS
jgi:hypothetical protein